MQARVNNYTGPTLKSDIALKSAIENCAHTELRIKKIISARSAGTSINPFESQQQYERNKGVSMLQPRRTICKQSAK